MRVIVRVIKRGATKDDRNRLEEKVEKALQGEEGLEISSETAG